jgi:hypothetical protein
MGALFFTSWMYYFSYICMYEICHELFPAQGS